MSLNVFSIVIVLSILAILPGCAATPPAQFANQPTRLLLGDDATVGPMEPVNMVLMNEAKLKTRLGKMRKPNTGAPKAKLKDLIDQIRSEHKTGNGLPSLSSLGGANGLAFVDSAAFKVGANGEFDANKTATLELSGQIVDYSYDPIQGSGELVVNTISTISDGTTSQSTEFVWTVEIKKHGYNVVWHSGNDNDPFPGTLAFDQEMLDRIKLKNFNVKLYATGAGKIKIKSLYRDGVEVRPPSKLLVPDPQSCIDMMFEIPQNQTIPTTFQELGNYSYCLGRCKSPAIINTP